MQMFIWNNIFFSLGFDVKDHYKDFGGDAAAYAAPVSKCSFYKLYHTFLILNSAIKLNYNLLQQSNDLQGVKAYFNLDPDSLYTLGTVVVDYRGYRITAQSIIPGKSMTCVFFLNYIPTISVMIPQEPYLNEKYL